VPIKRKCVDTGMGLERLASVVQGKEDNYSIDSIHPIFSDLLLRISLHSNQLKTLQNLSDSEVVAGRVIVDHMRCACFLLGEGVVPSNVGQGYVLRRILRRAIRYSQCFNIHEPFLYKMVGSVVDPLSETHEDIFARKETIREIIKREEEGFVDILSNGTAFLVKNINNPKPKFVRTDQHNNIDTSTLSDQLVFFLHARMGLPVEITQLIAADYNKKVDIEGVNKLLEQEKEANKNSWKQKTVPKEVMEWIRDGWKYEFIGYEDLEGEGQVLGWHQSERNIGWMVVSPCPFYPQSGGQVGDIGHLHLPGFPLLKVLDTLLLGDQSLLKVELREGVDWGKHLKEGVVVGTHVDPFHRKMVTAHHTATHLLHQALRDVLGNTIFQAGSLVSAEGLRFDFTHDKNLSEEEKQEVESIVNKAIRKDLAVSTNTLPYHLALQQGALTLQSQTYQQNVRLVTIPNFSAELCGGTHVRSTSELYPFSVVRQSSVSLGVKRIEAVAGMGSILHLEKYRHTVNQLADILQVPATNIVEKTVGLVKQKKEGERKIKELEKEVMEYHLSTCHKYNAHFSFIPFLLYVFPGEKCDVRMMQKIGGKLGVSEPQQVHCLASRGGIVCCIGKDIKSGKVKELEEVTGRGMVSEIAERLGSRNYGGNDSLGTAHFLPDIPLLLSLFNASPL